MYILLMKFILEGLVEDEIFLSDATFRNASSEELQNICKSWNIHEIFNLKFSELRTNQIYVLVKYILLSLPL